MKIDETEKQLHLQMCEESGLSKIAGRTRVLVHSVCIAEITGNRIFRKRLGRTPAGEFIC